ncbi:helix-turn-helix domain-containing protein [Kitasatospora kifunensis]|uniref:Transcriptional regulator with XRE-family HTH domain n=1 Tax=Kitasatospora kifunensis TaxID=58351 RepID=A0A7W7VZJ3_KITKI|nr:helix-turn-helix transcriptional regulator [Kitasatospora kifunensis]MBB4928857.1 transcriptional regulator with XRE-family HTH domain [Kitasatospora kifunensis]
MANRPPTQRRAVTGAISGYVLRLIRESIPHTQAGLAELLGMDLASVQGWESGRRPLANMRAGQLLDLRRWLPALGADAALVGMLDAAMDADRLIGTALDPGPHDHPLAGWVHTRDTAHMIAWALNGTTPPALVGRPAPVRRGAVANSPLLPSQERSTFFAHLRDITEAASRPGGSVLLRRQALYLASYDRSPEAQDWTAQALHGRRGVLSVRGWSPQWAEARSTAAALARQGDPQPLFDYIERAMVDDDDGEAANLNYWAYWLGATGTPQPDDAFMRDRGLTGWDAVTLLRRLTQGIHEAPGYVDLYAHSLWALLTVRPWLPQAAPELVTTLAGRTGRLLDSGRISSRARRDLDALQYLLQNDR